MTRRVLGVAAGLSLVVAIGAGCSSSGSSTASKGSDTTAAASGSGSASGSGGSASGCTDATNGEVKVVTKNFDFNPTCITVTGNRLKVTYDNQEAGVKHNIDFKDLKSSSGAAKTDLKAGPDTETVTLVDLKPGTYTYVCDIHANMKGTLTVKAS